MRNSRVQNDVSPQSFAAQLQSTSQHLFAPHSPSWFHLDISLAMTDVSKCHQERSQPKIMVSASGHPVRSRGSEAFQRQLPSNHQQRSDAHFPNAGMGLPELATPLRRPRSRPHIQFLRAGTLPLKKLRRNWGECPPWAVGVRVRSVRNCSLCDGSPRCGSTGDALRHNVWSGSRGCQRFAALGVVQLGRHKHGWRAD